MHIYTIGEQEIWFHYFFNPYFFRTSVKTTFKGKKFNKAAIKCNLLTGFLTTYLKYRLSLSSFCSKQLTSNRCISGLPCSIAMQFLSSESTFKTLHLIMTFEAVRTTLKVEKQK